jgi:hypothetical protein
MVAIVIRTNCDEGTESAEVARSELYVLQELFPFRLVKRLSFHANFNENDIFSTIICSNFNVV